MDTVRRKFPSLRYWAHIDSAGAFASTLCIMHCFATAALGFLLPAFGLSLFGSEALHRALAGIVIAVALLAFVPGFRLHRDVSVAAPALIGFASLILAQFLGEAVGELGEAALTILGGGVLIAAHVRNRRLCKVHRCDRCT